MVLGRDTIDGPYVLHVDSYEPVIPISENFGRWRSNIIGEKRLAPIRISIFDDVGKPNSGLDNLDDARLVLEAISNDKIPYDEIREMMEESEAP